MSNSALCHANLEVYAYSSMCMWDACLCFQCALLFNMQRYKINGDEWNVLIILGWLCIRCAQNMENGLTHAVNAHCIRD